VRSRSVVHDPLPEKTKGELEQIQFQAKSLQQDPDLAEAVGFITRPLMVAVDPAPVKRLLVD